MGGGEGVVVGVLDVSRVGGCSGGGACGCGGGDEEAEVDVGGEIGEVGRQSAQGVRGDEHTGAGVVDDVGRLFGGQVRVDHGVVEAGALQAPGHLVGAVVVGQHHGDTVARAQAVGVEGLGQPARARFEFGVGDDLAGTSDHGRPVGVGGGEGGWPVRGGQVGHVPPSSPGGRSPSVLRPNSELSRM